MTGHPYVGSLGLTVYVIAYHSSSIAYHSSLQSTSGKLGNGAGLVRGSGDVTFTCSIPSVHL